MTEEGGDGIQLRVVGMNAFKEDEEEEKGTDLEDGGSRVMQKGNSVQF